MKKATTTTTTKQKNKNSENIYIPNKFPNTFLYLQFH